MTQTNHDEPKRDRYPYKRFFTCLEVSFVVVVSILVIVGLGFVIFTSGDPAKTKVGQIIKLLNDNWKVLLLPIIPLFYYPVRDFLGRLTEAGALKAKPPDKPEAVSPLKEKS